jgi:hypothetical protein
MGKYGRVERCCVVAVSLLFFLSFATSLFATQPNPCSSTTQNKTCVMTWQQDTGVE